MLCAHYYWREWSRTRLIPARQGYCLADGKLLATSWLQMCCQTLPSAKCMTCMVRRAWKEECPQVALEALRASEEGTPSHLTWCVYGLCGRGTVLSAIPPQEPAKTVCTLAHGYSIHKPSVQQAMLPQATLAYKPSTLWAL